jgi:hypothetical protein
VLGMLSLALCASAQMRETNEGLYRSWLARDQHQEADANAQRRLYDKFMLGLTRQKRVTIDPVLGKLCI